MNITYFYPSLHYPGGISRVLTVKMNYLADVLGYNITIVTYSQFNKGIFFPLSERINQVHLNLLSTNSINGSFVERKNKERKFLKQYKSKIEDFLTRSPQDILVTTTLGLEYKFFNKLKDKSKKIAEYHFAFNKSPLSSLKDLKSVRNFKDLIDVYERLLYIKRISSLDSLVLLTNRDKLKWQKLFKNTCVISNPITINSKEISSLSSQQALAIGRMHPQKGFDYLIDVWRIVVDNNPQWNLKIIGDGNELDNILSKIKLNNLESNVVIEKQNSNVKQAYLDSSIYIMTSRFEGLPLVLIEAMHMGLPIVSFDCECGPSDLIENGVNGYLTEVGDIKSTANRIIEIINDNNLKREISKNNRLKSFHYQLEPIMNQWNNLFNSLINE